MDQYESTKSGLGFFHPRMSKGGVIVMDDYRYEDCPGVMKAINEFYTFAIDSSTPYQGQFVIRY
jgi:hypothetical protein